MYGSLRTGDGGFACLTYEDWLENAMDCWVAQLGVVTEQHREASAATTLRVVDGMVRVAADPVLRAEERNDVPARFLQKQVHDEGAAGIH